MGGGKRIKLGLIGKGIQRSLAPRLHEHLGREHGLDVRYRLIDSDGVPDFDPLAAAREAAQAGYTGVNVTHPFKQVLAAHAVVSRPEIARLGAINTLCFRDAGWSATNTDYTGFLQAYRHQFGETAPGRVVMAGAGGVGRSVAYGLAGLRAEQVAIYDRDEALAATLVAELSAATGAAAVALTAAEFPQAVDAADGLINCTPVGMHPYPGTPFPLERVGRQRWAFDAVYSPLWTQFLAHAREAGLATLTGFELFFFQGLDAFEEFTGVQVAPSSVREVVLGWLRERD